MKTSRNHRSRLRFEAPLGSLSSVFSLRLGDFVRLAPDSKMATHLATTFRRLEERAAPRATGNEVRAATAQFLVQRVWDGAPVALILVACHLLATWSHSEKRRLKSRRGLVWQGPGLRESLWGISGGPTNGAATWTMPKTQPNSAAVPFQGRSGPKIASACSFAAPLLHPLAFYLAKKRLKKGDL